MIETIVPKLPMHHRKEAEKFYRILGFETLPGSLQHYLMMRNGALEIHFFEHRDLECDQNYGQIYIRCSALEQLYNQYTSLGVKIHPEGSLKKKPWGQTEFSILDPVHNLITFGENIHAVQQ